MHKIINGAIPVDLHNCVSVSHSTTRGSKYKSTKYHAKLDIRKYFVFITVNVWKFLHDNIVGCKTAHGFIMKLKSLKLARFLKGQDVRSK